MSHQSNQSAPQINGMGASDIYELTNEERMEEEQTGTLNQKSISHLLKQADQAIGNKRFKRATIFVGDSK